MKWFEKIFFLYAIVFAINDLFAQNIVFSRLDKKEIEFPLFVELNFDNDTTFSFTLESEKLIVDTTLFNDFVNINVNPKFGQVYHNQIKRNQIQRIDTIIINQTNLIKKQTPRLLIGRETNLDSIFINQLWIKEWLEDYNEIINGISFWVYSTNSLKESEKLKVKKIIKEYCNKIGQEEYYSFVEFKNLPYITGQEDFFIDGTIIDNNFINSQNTDYMKNYAEKYSLVVSVIIDWKNK